MGDAAVDLALDDQRIDAAACILDRDIARNRDAAGLDVDFDLDDVTGVAIGELVDAKARAGFEAGLDALRKAVTRRALEHAREIAELDGKLRCADDANLAVDDFKILFGGFQHVASELERFRRHRCRRDLDRGAGGNRLPAGEAAQPERRGRGVAGNHADVLRAHAERLGANLRQAVASPWPIGAAPVETVTRLVGEMRTLPNSNGPRPVPLMPWASPMPI